MLDVMFKLFNGFDCVKNCNESQCCHKNLLADAAAQTFVNEKMVCWFDCWSLAVVLLLFPFMSLAKLNFDMFTYLLPCPATKSSPLWNDGDFGMLTFSLCSILSSSAAVDATLIAWTILWSTSLPILTATRVTVSFKRRNLENAYEPQTFCWNQFPEKGFTCVMWCRAW